MKNTSLSAFPTEEKAIAKNFELDFAEIMTATVAERRVKKELQKLRKDPLDGISVEVGSNSSEWFVEIVGE